MKLAKDKENKREEKSKNIRKLDQEVQYPNNGNPDRELRNWNRGNNQKLIDEKFSINK